jgi:prephenate dehydrogenase
MNNFAQAQRVLIVGTGLIGTSIAMGLSRLGREVFVSDIDESAAALAATRAGASPWAGQSDIDLAVVCTPPSAVAQTVRELLSVLPTAVVTDVASVKSPVFDALADLAPELAARFVGSHPMAGREVSGAAAAQHRLFIDRPWVITATPQTSEAAVGLVVGLAQALGANVVHRNVAEHDRAVALISHAPQAVASVLAQRLVDAPAQDVALAGQGVRDTIRLAGSDAKLWLDIFAGNATNVAGVLNQVSADLVELASAISAGDAAAILHAIELGNEGHKKLPGKHGQSASSLVTLVVRVEDKPGELARLFAAAGSANVNLEDVRIDHSLGAMTGLVELAVAPSSRDQLATALTSADFEVAG